MNVDTGVYTITNIVNGQIYVGSTYSFRRRWNTHQRQLRNGIHPNRKLQSAWNKYGHHAFRFDAIALCPCTDLLIVEQRRIDLLQPEYNLAPVAGSQLGFRQPIESILKSAEKRRGKYLGENSPNWGRKTPPETRALQSARRMGRYTGKNHPNAIEIICVEGGIRFDSLLDAERWLRANGHPKASKSAICNACRSDTRTAYGYTWRRSGSANLISILGRSRSGENSPYSKPVLCVDTGAKFPGISEAARWLQANGKPKASNSAIVSACKGRQKHAYGFRWVYADTLI